MHIPDAGGGELVMPNLHEHAVQADGGVSLRTHLLLLVLPQEHVAIQPIKVPTVPDLLWTFS